MQLHVCLLALACGSQRTTFGVILKHAVHLAWDSLWPGTHPSRLNWLFREPQRFTCLHFASAGLISMLRVSDIFIWILDIWTQVLILTWQALYELSYFPQLCHLFYLMFSVFILSTWAKTYLPLSSLFKLIDINGCCKCYSDYYCWVKPKLGTQMI